MPLRGGVVGGNKFFSKTCSPLDQYQAKGGNHPQGLLPSGPVRPSYEGCNAKGTPAGGGGASRKAADTQYIFIPPPGTLKGSKRKGL